MYVMDLLPSFQQNWQKSFSFLSANNTQLLLAVSGGLDSVVLSDLVARTGIPFTIAHVNFQLRGAESERDEAFVRSLGEKYGQEVLVLKADTQSYAETHKCAIQEAAREIRYKWFEDLRTQINEKGKTIFIVTAHHADDTVETMMMHFFRGTGLQGLTGIQPLLKERKIIRPLLAFRKEELLKHAQVLGLRFVEDSSNASDKYTRNYFRNKLIPEIREVYPKVEDNILHNAARLQEAFDLYQQAVAMHVNNLLLPKGNEYHLPLLKWQKTVPLLTITWEIIRQFGFTSSQTTEVVKLMDAANGAYIASPTHQIIKNRNWMIIAPLSAAIAMHIVIDESDDTIAFEGGSLQMTTKLTAPKQVPIDLMEAYLDADKIKYPLLLRKSKTGDYFYPLGMQKKKKLSRFLIDLKLSKLEKEKIWVLESNKKIIWVLGYRIDDRFKLTIETKNCVKISYRK